MPLEYNFSQSVKLTDIFGDFRQNDFVKIAEALCQAIHQEGIIEQVRAVVNHPKWNDQEPAQTE